MKRRAFTSALVAAGGFAALRPLLAAQPKSPDSLQIDGNQAGLGVYLGAGCTGSGRLAAYEAWLGRPVDQVIEFISWDALKTGRTWAPNCWRKAGKGNVVYSIPMVPSGGAAQLRQGADGRFDDLFRNYGAQLVKTGYGNSVIRIGWEFNAEWYAWAASKDPSAWIDCWRRIASVMRATPGASFKFDWCIAAAARGFNAELAYPGDDVVDIIGMDFYNMPIDGAQQTPQDRWQTRMNMQHGLRWHRDFAGSHRKRMSLPEWGTGVNVKWGGPPDDPYFIEQVAQWIADNAVIYHNYWEYSSKEFDCTLSHGGQPQGAAKYVQKFGGKALRAAALVREDKS